MMQYFFVKEVVDGQGWYVSLKEIEIEEYDSQNIEF
jgi:hypothetical protein